ncbi:Uncharacterised protein [Mycobacteroides abscessus subsp. abscessus]|nr:Uncharacterised protein [Mycobacteroides abscessus subsp. abscessus]
MFGGDDLGELLLAGVEQFAEREEDRRALGQGRVAPAGERLGGGPDRAFRGGGIGERDLPRDLSGGGVRHLAEAGVGSGGNGPSVDPVGDGGHGGVLLRR